MSGSDMNQVKRVCWHKSHSENRPVLWTYLPTTGTVATVGDTIAMSYDRMGRRVTKNAERFVYDGYLQIANHRSTPTTPNYNSFTWDPTEPVATRPLVWNNSSFIIPNSSFYYAHDGNKNVSEVIANDGVHAAHYEYAPFGVATTQYGDSAAANPWRFSSEYADDELGCDYYNYRHYEPMTGRWESRDPYDEDAALSGVLTALDSMRKKMVETSLSYRDCQNNEYGYLDNSPAKSCDLLGLLAAGRYPDWGGTDEHGVAMPPYKFVPTKGNCWRYACNDPKMGYEKARVNPPGWNGHSNSCSAMCSEVAKKAGVENSTASAKCKKCWYKVLLAAGDRLTDNHGGTIADYHWYRQDDDGSWSHKPGDLSVITNVSNPEDDARNRGYDNVCGYFCFREGGVDADR